MSYLQSPFLKKDFPEIKESNKGKFTAWAKKRGMSVCKAANMVMSKQKEYTPAVVKMANYAKNFGCKSK